MSSTRRSFIDLLRPPRDTEQIEPVDLEMVRRVVPLLKVIRAYFRAEVHGLSHLPRGEALVVGNHNGGITTLEPILLGLELYLKSPDHELMYYLAHDAMLAIPLLGRVLSRLGNIRASHKSAGRALAAGHKVVVFPGGNYEAFRPYTQRHAVDFGGRTGFIRLALTHQVPVVPLLTLGGHETFFVLRRGERLARWTGVRRLLRSDSFPLFLGLPWGVGLGPIFHFPLPAKLWIELGPPVDLGGYGPEEVADPRLLKELSLKVQSRLQEMMDRRAAERRWPILG